MQTKKIVLLKSIEQTQNILDIQMRKKYYYFIFKPKKVQSAHHWEPNTCILDARGRPRAETPLRHHRSERTDDSPGNP